MSASKRLEDLTDEQRAVFIARSDRLEVNGSGLKSPYHEISPGVILDKKGAPMYDRPVIRERPSVMVVVWGVDKDGELRLGMIHQQRPPADDPTREGNGHEPVVFGQVVMGYFEIGDTLKEAALRERLEEAGKVKVLEVTELPFPHINLEPNTWATWHSVAFVRVDLSTVDEQYSEATEFIKSVTYLTASELFDHVVRGRDDTGAYYRGTGTTLGPLMIFFAWLWQTHPDLFPRR